MIKVNKYIKSTIFIVCFSFVFHLISLNFHPTNFEGGYGAFANFFDSNDKIKYLNAYYNKQFNTYLFSFLGSSLNILFPFLDGYQSIKLISASSYIFLSLGIINILKFYNFINNKNLFLFIVLFNCIIWNYGFRSFNDLFAYSVAIYFFSNILISNNSKSIYLNSFLLGISTIIKSYNLILLIPIFFHYFNKNKKKIILNLQMIYIFLLILIPFIIFHLTIYKHLGFLFAPKNEDLQIAIIGNDPRRDFFWVLNNLIFYIGYLILITFPFSIIFYLNIVKKFNFKILSSIILIILFCIYFQNFLFISSELDLGPLQKYIPNNLYKTIILFGFFSFFILLISFKKNNKFSKKKYNEYLVIIITILVYLIMLSFIKAAQRYLILPLPFFLLFLFNVIQPKKIIFGTLVLYTFINFFLLFNYYITGKSTQQILAYLKKENILEHTNPGVMMPNVYHMYNNCYLREIEEANLKCTENINNAVKLISSKYKITYYKDNTMYSSNLKIFGINFYKYSVTTNK